MSSIRLHPQHGLNPTIPVCWYCGKAKNEVVLLGAAYKEQASMHMILDKEPCEECKGWMEQGIILIEVEEPRPGENPENPRRLGGFVVVTEDAIKRMVQPPELVEHLLKRRGG